MNSLSIMRSDKGWTVVILKTDGYNPEEKDTIIPPASPNHVKEPEIKHFGTFEEVKQFINTLIP